MQYTAFDIERIRKAVTPRVNSGSGNYSDIALSEIGRLLGIESRVLTCIAAGLTPEAVEYETDTWARTKLKRWYDENGKYYPDEQYSSITPMLYNSIDLEAIKAASWFKERGLQL